MRRPEFLLLLGVLFFAPLAFGTVEPWSRAVVDVVSLGALALALHRRTSDGATRVRDVPGALPLALFLGFVLLQTVPLPPALLGILSPGAHAWWGRTLGVAGPLPWVPLSLDPLATVRELLRFTACAAVYVLTVQLLARRERLRATAAALAVFAAALSFAALLQALVAPTRLLFLRAAPPGHPFGPFVNRNHYANLMAMLTPVLIALFLTRGGAPRARTLRRRVADLLASREANVRLLLGFAALLAATSLVVSLSRGATVAVAAGLCTLLVLLARRGLLGRGALALLLLAAAFAVVAGWFGWDRVAARFTEAGPGPALVDSFRAAAWEDTLRMARDFPAAGAGVGSFERLYPGYRTFHAEEALAHAHHDWLELLAGGGAVGLGLFLWFLAAALRRALKPSGERDDGRAPGLALGAVAGCVAFLVHGLSDFSLSIGANALTFFFLLGLAVAAAAARRDQEGCGPLPRRRLPALALHLATALAVAAAVFHGGGLIADRAWALARGEILRSDAPQVPHDGAVGLITLASRAQPLEAAYPSALARVAARRGDLPAAVRQTRAALRRRPLDAVALRQLGGYLAAGGEAERARRAFEAAVAVGPAEALNHEVFGAWLLARGETEAAVGRLREAVELDPARTPTVIALLALAGFPDEGIAAAIPPRPGALVRFARYLETTGAAAAAARRYRQALGLDPANPEAREGLRRVGAAVDASGARGLESGR